MLVLALAAAAAAPQPGVLRTFNDWTVGCDNGRACQAVALLSESGLAGGSLVLRRGSEANAPVAAWFALNDVQPVSAMLGDRTLRLNPADGRVLPADLPALIAALRKAPSLTVRAADGTTYPVSLAGASAALLYMDDAQKRAGTTLALVRPGARRAPAPPALPVVTRPPASPRLIPGIDRASLLKAHADTSCDRVAKPADVEIARLDAANSLVIVPDHCGSGAYNMNAVVLIADNRGRTRPARFETPPGFTDDSTIVNGGWNAQARRLTSYVKGRGIGDCGVVQTYAWDGARFRLIELSRMDECRGSTDWITVWRAIVR